jgi:hypothetical protein
VPDDPGWHSGDLVAEIARISERTFYVWMEKGQRAGQFNARYRRSAGRIEQARA